MSNERLLAVLEPGVDDRRQTDGGGGNVPGVYPDLTPEQLDGMEMWNRDPAVFQERSRPIWAMLVRSAVAEIRRRRAANLSAEDISRIRATRDEMARFDFLDQIPELIQTLDRILAATVVTPSGRWTPPVERPLRMERAKPSDYVCSNCGETMARWEQFDEYQHDTCGGLVELAGSKR